MRKVSQLRALVLYISTQLPPCMSFMIVNSTPLCFLNSKQGKLVASWPWSFRTKFNFQLNLSSSGINLTLLFFVNRRLVAFCQMRFWTLLCLNHFFQHTRSRRDRLMQLGFFFHFPDNMLTWIETKKIRASDLYLQPRELKPSNSVTMEGTPSN